MRKYKIVWEKIAKSDYRGIWVYIAKESVYYADKFGDEIEESIERLITDPLIGQVEEYLKKFKLGHRYLVYSHYKIIYRISEDKVFISAIFDTRQKLSKLRKIVKKTI